MHVFTPMPLRGSDRGIKALILQPFEVCCAFCLPFELKGFRGSPPPQFVYILNAQNESRNPKMPAKPQKKCFPSRAPLPALWPPKPKKNSGPALPSPPSGTPCSRRKMPHVTASEAGSNPRGHLRVTWGVYLCAGKPPLADIILSHPPDLTRCDSVIGLAIPAMSGHIQYRGAAS